MRSPSASFAARRVWLLGPDGRTSDAAPRSMEYPTPSIPSILRIWAMLRSLSMAMCAWSAISVRLSLRDELPLIAITLTRGGNTLVVPGRRDRWRPGDGRGGLDVGDRLATRLAGRHPTPRRGDPAVERPHRPWSREATSEGRESRRRALQTPHAPACARRSSASREAGCARRETRTTRSRDEPARRSSRLQRARAHPRLATRPSRGHDLRRSSVGATWRCDRTSTAGTGERRN